MEGFDFDKAVAHLSKDKKLKAVIDMIQLPERNPSSDVYAGLLRSIVGQQLSVKAATTIHGRFIDLFSTEYPVAKELLIFKDEQLRGVGLSGQKTGYVRNVAQFFQEHDLFDKDWSEYSDEEIIKLLTQIKGVGKWTVEMILMFVLKRPDVFPVLDLGVQQGLAQIYNLKEEKKALHNKMEKLSQKWRPYRSVACLYFWAVKDSV